MHTIRLIADFGPKNGELYAYTCQLASNTLRSGSRDFAVFVVKQAPQQNAPDTRNVSVILVDVMTNTKVPLGACVRIGDVSNIGCDRDLIDGQIDFLDVEAGTHDIVDTSLPAGYTVTNPDDLVVTIDAQNDPVNVFVYIHVIRQP